MTRAMRTPLSRRSFLAAGGGLATLAATGALSACGSGRSAGGSSAGAAMTMWGITGDQPFIEPTVTEWNAAHADSAISANYFGTNDYKDKIRTGISSAQAPTLVYTWGGGTMRSYVDAGLVQDLTGPLSGKSGFLDKVLPSVLDAGKVDGKTYAVPLSASAPVLFYYNHDVLTKVGIEQPKTWDDLMSAVPKIKSAGFAPISLGGGSKWPYLMWIEYLVDRIGGPDVFKRVLDNTEGAWSDPAVLQACQQIQDLISAGGFADGYASVSADTNADLALMATGRAAMLLQGAWAFDSIDGIAKNFVSDGKLAYGAFPAVSGGKGDPMNIAGNPSQFWAVSSKANPQQTSAAIDYFSSTLWTDPYTKRLADSGNIPPVKDASALLPKGFPQGVYEMIQKAPSFQMSWDLALSPAASAAFWTQLDLLFNKSSTPQKFADAMNKTIGK
ncbi:ABC transporter substrate-binding protein [Microlunatus flavus]|uniref:Raffinose/stachyose/melibiose transport system substrate-binding protein n=1 Tax=Microlunatus flavus TaxID=1036181 RepID=A0A1H9K6V1_9ACTN|nr:extracellular solute-binding protein [Microlunatus flavus]SEQ94667.1 raffinose/stachyose/melibiose transport system substrate-binding protein [Microlunatus flavus]